MKRLVNDARFVFTALQVCSVIAMIPAVYIAWCAVATGGAAWLEVGTTMLEGLLWIAMWGSFLLMCGRLKREPSAFTERNARTLMFIAVCCMALGMMMVAEAVIAAAPLAGSLFFIALPGSAASVVVFFGVGAVALVLRRLLKSAMELQQDNDLTI